VETLAERFRQAGHPYAVLFEQLIDIFGLSEVAANSQAEAID
jgi:hypothetical protein